jgi:hypothetical protein
MPASRPAFAAGAREAFSDAKKQTYRRAAFPPARLGSATERGRRGAVSPGGLIGGHRRGTFLGAEKSRGLGEGVGWPKAATARGR